MKHFWLIRHAKSDWNLPDQADVERDLNTRGRRDGELMQAAFERLSANSGHQPDWLVTSRATRAQATAEYVLAGSGLARDHMIVDPGLYNATPEALLAALREAPIEAQCVALVAHNPGLTWLVNALGGAAGDAPELPLDNLPTFGSALFASDIESWPDLQAATLLQLVTPKILKTQSRDT